MTPRPDGPITAEKVMGWFEAAKVKGATPESMAAFAEMVERRRALNEAALHPVIQDSSRALGEYIAACRTLQGVLDRLPNWLQKGSDVSKLRAALAPVVQLEAELLPFRPVIRVPASARGRPTDDGTRAAADFNAALEASLPKRTSKRARMAIVERALRACGYGVEKTVENIARADRRRRAQKRT